MYDLLKRQLIKAIGRLPGRLLPIVGGMIVDYIDLIDPTRNLWQIIKPKELVIVASESANTWTGQYFRPGTGIGQVVALVYAVESLRTGYGILDIENVHLSTDEPQERRLNDLLLLGSPKTNRVARDFLDLIGDVQPARQTEEGDIYWGKMVGGHRISEGEERFPKDLEEGEKTKDHSIDHDYGLIVRAENPFNTRERRTVVLFSGKHTYGTMAAAIYFVKNMNRCAAYQSSKKENKNNFAALVEADVRGSFTPNPNLVEAEVAVRKVGPRDTPTVMEEKFYAW